MNTSRLDTSRRAHGPFIALLACTTVFASTARADPSSSAKPSHAAMDAAIGHYVVLCADLALERSDTIAGHLRLLKGALSKVSEMKGGGAEARAVRALASEAAGVFTADPELHSGEKVRVRKQLFALSRPLVRYVGRYRAVEHRWKTYYCDMAKASWLQPWTDVKLANPYYGTKMLRCGDAVRTTGE